MDFNEVVRRLMKLEDDFKHHKHSGKDSRRLELDQITNQGSLTTKDTSTVDGTYGSEEQAVIDNNRTRIEEIEDALKANNILS